LRVTVRLFARLRDAAGDERLAIELSPGATVAAAVEAVVAGRPALAPLRAVIQVAVNATHARPDRVLAEGDEVALFPPFSGG
jgi:molybdopterin converting factor subunit 1